MSLFSNNRITASCFHLLTGLCLSAFVFCLFSVCAEPVSVSENTFFDGVKAYRDGRYIEAKALFAQLHQANPQDSRLTYYLAITEAQLGRFQQAKALYEEIVLLDPNSEAAQRARQGLSYLPADQNALDLPPRFQTGTAQAQDSTSANAVGMPGMSNGSPQDWMLMQMMMGQMGGNSGFNPMMGGMPGGESFGGNPMGNIDPNVMSSLLMNQMMQNFSLDGNKDDNR